VEVTLMSSEISELVFTVFQLMDAADSVLTRVDGACIVITAVEWDCVALAVSAVAPARLAERPSRKECLVELDVRGIDHESRQAAVFDDVRANTSVEIALIGCASVAVVTGSDSSNCSTISSVNITLLYHTRTRSIRTSLLSMPAFSHEAGVNCAQVSVVAILWCEHTESGIRIARVKSAEIVVVANDWHWHTSSTISHTNVVDAHVGGIWWGLTNHTLTWVAHARGWIARVDSAWVVVVAILRDWGETCSCGSVAGVRDAHVHISWIDTFLCVHTDSSNASVVGAEVVVVAVDWNSHSSTDSSVRVEWILVARSLRRLCASDAHVSASER
jgi:hypothetical protein